MFSLTMVWVPRLVSPKQYTLYITIISIMGSLASILGPILGGAIVEHTVWRWIFWINLPAGCVSILSTYLALPGAKLSSDQLRQVDWIACELLSVGSVCLVLALASIGISYVLQWRAILGLSIVAGFHIVGFITWQFWLKKSNYQSIRPLLPWYLLQRRSIAALQGTNFLAGFTIFAISILLPQRLQIVDQLSPTAAGLRMLPFLVTCPLGTIFSGSAITQWKIPSLYILIFAQIMQFGGVLPLGFLPTSAQQSPSATLYMCQVLIGLGVGASTVASILLLKHIVSIESFDILTGLATQLRITGGAVVVAICSAALRSKIIRTLTPLLTAAELSQIFRSTAVLSANDPTAADYFRVTWATAFNLEMKIIAGVSFLSTLTSLLVWQKKNRLRGNLSE